MSNLKKVYQDMISMNAFFKHTFEAFSWIAIVTAMSVAVYFYFEKAEYPFAHILSISINLSLIFILLTALVSKVLLLFSRFHEDFLKLSHGASYFYFVVAMLVMALLVAFFILITMAMMGFAGAQLAEILSS